MDLIEKDQTSGAVSCTFEDGVGTHIVVVCPIEYDRDMLIKTTGILRDDLWYSECLEILNETTRIEIYGCPT